MIRQDNANGTFTTYSYDADGNPLHVVNHAPGGAINSEFDGTYNPLNQLVTLATPDGSWTYSYDAGGQLTRAIFTLTDPGIADQDLAYAYDPVGNRISTIINGVTTNYVVNSMNEYTSIGGVAQEYDGNGNLVFDGTTTYTYNPLNQFTGFSNALGSSQFSYNCARRARQLDRGWGVHGVSQRSQRCGHADRRIQRCRPVGDARQPRPGSRQPDHRLGRELFLRC